MRIWHPFHSTKGDGPDSQLVRPVDWNADHKFETAADGVVLGRAAGGGPGAVQEIPFRALGIFNESVLVATSPELVVAVPAGAKYVELQFLTANNANTNDVLVLNAMNGTIVINVPVHNIQLLLGTGTSPVAAFSQTTSWQLGTLAAGQGIIRPQYITLGTPHQVLGTGQWWGINAAGTRYVIQASFDGGGSVEPTGYRLSNAGGTFFAPGSFLRSLTIQ